MNASSMFALEREYYRLIDEAAKDHALIHDKEKELAELKNRVVGKLQSALDIESDLKKDGCEFSPKHPALMEVYAKELHIEQMFE